MDRIKKVLIVKVLVYSGLIIFTIQMQGQTLRVPEEYSTIGLAIQAAENGDTVLVNDGFYPEQVNFLGKNIVVASYYILDQDSSHIYNTEINRSYQDEGVMFINWEEPDAQLVGFFISNCRWEAVYCENSSPTIRNNIIKGNAATGVYLRESAAIVSENEIHGYPGFDQGGPYNAVFIINSGPVIERNYIKQHDDMNVNGIELWISNLNYPGVSIIIRENMIIGGIFGDFPSNGLPQLVHHNIFLPGEETTTAMNITHCGEGFMIYNNTVYGGTGIWIQHGDYADIRNNLVAFTNYGIMSSIDTVTVAYNNIWQTEDKHLALNDYIGKNGNICADPALADPDHGNFHYNCWSACIDAGDPTMDYSLEPGPNGGRINIGRYGNTAEAEPSVACLRVSPELLDFGFVEAFGQKDSVVFLHNKGHDLMLVSALSNSDTANFSQSYGNGTTILSPGDSLPVIASFHPVNLLAMYNDSIIVTSNSAIPGMIYMTGETNVGINEILNQEGFEIFPVPVSEGYLTLVKSKPWTGRIKIEIITASGNIVFSENLCLEWENTFRIITGKLKDGIYCLKIVDGKQVSVKKFVCL